MIDGGTGDDLICSLNREDLVTGGRGDDRIDGGDNQDTLEGGPGDDYLAAGSSSYYADFPGGETVSYEHSSGPISVDLTTGIATGDGTDTILGFFEIVGSDYATFWRGTSVSRDNGDYIDRRGSDDLIYGSNANFELRDVLLGGEGNDSLHGLQGWDMLFGDEGNDSLFGNRSVVNGGPGDDAMDGGRRRDTVRFGGTSDGEQDHPGAMEAVRADLATGEAVGEGNDIFSNVEALAGTPFDNLLLGDGGPNSLFGGDGKRHSPRPGRRGLSG